MLITNPPKSSTYVYPDIDKQPHLPPRETLLKHLKQLEAALPEGNVEERSLMKQKELSGEIREGRASYQTPA
jgi:hypothetical protein